jgi:hypothetical protein
MIQKEKSKDLGQIIMFIFTSIESEENEFPLLPYAAWDTILKAARCKFN